MFSYFILYISLFQILNPDLFAGEYEIEGYVEYFYLTTVTAETFSRG